MPYNLSHMQTLERAIIFGNMKKDDLSPEDRKNFDAYQQEKQKEVEERKTILDQDQFKRFLNSVSPSLPTNAKNVKLVGGNWFTFDLEGVKYMSYYYYQQNSTTPIFSCLTRIS